MGGHGDGAGPLPGEPQAGQEGAGLGEAAMRPGQPVDAVGGFGGGANRLRGEGPRDGVGVVGQFADRAVVRLPPPQAVEPAVAVGDQISLGGGDADTGQVGGLLAGVAEVNGPEDEHLATDDRVGVLVAVGENGGLLVRGQGGAKPSGHP